MGMGQAWNRFARRVERVPLPLLSLVAVGLVLRIALTDGYRPAIATSYDTVLFVEMAGGELFSDATRTVGYPLFLRSLHAISGDVDVTVAAQHLLGIGSAILLYAMVRRLGAPAWTALVGAAAILLSLDQIFLEHVLMAESPFTFLLLAGLYMAVRALDEPGTARWTSRDAWIAAAGLTIGLAAWLRPVSVPIAAFLAVWLALAIPGSGRARLRHGAIAAVSAGALVLAYSALSVAETDHFGLSRASGWALYSRAAPFADCDAFTPPERTERLCEASSPETRPGPDFYGWQPESPAWRIYGGPPNGDGELGGFARAAILGQPLSYLEVVGRDLMRYFHPALSPQDFSGLGYEEFDVELRLPATEDRILAAMNAYYDDESLELSGLLATLGEIQDIVRVHPKLMLIAVVLAATGIWLTHGRLRAGLVLLLGTFLIAIAIPPATAIWSSRYAIPVSGPVIAAGAIGAWVLVERVRSRGRASD